ncbi:hypothetical protein CHISP_3331 [Chitinispirillum alkaliphilum]|nr:hypothetical protein CHISP_3331 [Chitinispirillum alkaliphilum]
MRRKCIFLMLIALCFSNLFVGHVNANVGDVKNSSVEAAIFSKGSQPAISKMIEMFISIDSLEGGFDSIAKKSLDLRKQFESELSANPDDFGANMGFALFLLLETFAFMELQGIIDGDNSEKSNREKISSVSLEGIYPNAFLQMSDNLALAEEYAEKAIGLFDKAFLVSAAGVEKYIGKAELLFLQSIVISHRAFADAMLMYDLQLYSENGLYTLNLQAITEESEQDELFEAFLYTLSSENTFLRRREGSASPADIRDQIIKSIESLAMGIQMTEERTETKKDYLIPPMISTEENFNGISDLFELVGLERVNSFTCISQEFVRLLTGERKLVIFGIEESFEFDISEYFAFEGDLRDLLPQPHVFAMIHRGMDTDEAKAIILDPSVWPENGLVRNILEGKYSGLGALLSLMFNSMSETGVKD